MDLDDPGERAALVALNEQAVPAVPAVTSDRLRALVAMSAQAEVVEDARSAGLAGFVLVLPAGAPYESPFFGWFAERFATYAYLDRVVVAPPHKRRGVGTLVYDAMETRSRVHERLFCEVNVDPPNPDSLAFHAARGFVEIGRFAQPGDKLCAMLAKQLR